MCNKTNMINEEWNKTQNDAPFVVFYDTHAVTFVLPDKMADVSIAVVYSYTPIKPHTDRLITIPYPIYIEKKI